MKDYLLFLCLIKILNIFILSNEMWGLESEKISIYLK